MEDDDSIPDLVPSPYDSMPYINIHVNGVAKLLGGHKAHKATGTDEMPACLLREAADQLIPILTSLRSLVHPEHHPHRMAICERRPHFQKRGSPFSGNLPTGVACLNMFQSNGTYHQFAGHATSG